MSHTGVRKRGRKNQKNVVKYLNKKKTKKHLLYLVPLSVSNVFNRKTKQ